MEYQGVKFQTKNCDRPRISDPRLAELIKWAGIFHDQELAPLYEGGSYGNLSFRMKQDIPSFFITASHTALNGKLSGSDFVQVHDCDLCNNSVYIAGDGEPSSETLLHFAIYNSRKEVNAILHGHCESIMNNAGSLKLIQTEKTAIYGTTGLVEQVLKIVAKDDFLIMKDHGFLSLGRSISEAGELALKILYKCRI